jgi:hypothetical protein
MIAKRLLWLSLSICIVGGSSLAWHSLAPHFEFFDNRSRLKETMKVIEDGINSVGPVNYVLNYHNNVTGEDRTVRSRQEISKVSADPDSCMLIYEHRLYLNTTHHDIGYVVHLKYVKRIAVVTMEQDLKKSAAAMGHPEFSTQASPPVFVLEAIKSDANDQNVFLFLNAELANRMAKAWTHAVELCGGGK